PPRLTRKAKARLLAHDWPGNVRELRNVVEALVLLRGGRPARVADLPAALRPGTAGDAASTSPRITLELDDGLEALVDQIVMTALELDEGNKTRAAARLRISARTVQRYVASGRVRPA